MFSPDAGEPFSAAPHDGWDVGESLDIVDQRGMPEHTAFRRIRRTWTRSSALTFNGGNERGLLAANKCARPEADGDTKIELCTANVVAEQAVSLSQPQRSLEPGHRQRVFGPHIHVAFDGAHGIGGDRHSLDYAMR